MSLRHPVQASARGHPSLPAQYAVVLCVCVYVFLVLVRVFASVCVCLLCLCVLCLCMYIYACIHVHIKMKEGDFMYVTHLSKHNKCLIAGLCLSF